MAESQSGSASFAQDKDILVATKGFTNSENVHLTILQKLYRLWHSQRENDSPGSEDESNGLSSLR